jgi:hypothetical protein
LPNHNSNKDKQNQQVNMRKVNTERIYIIQYNYNIPYDSRAELYKNSGIHSQSIQNILPPSSSQFDNKIVEEKQQPRKIKYLVRV